MPGMRQFHWFLAWGSLAAVPLLGMGCQTSQLRERTDAAVVAEREFERLSHPVNVTWYRTPHDHATARELELVAYDGTIGVPPCASPSPAGSAVVDRSTPGGTPAAASSSLAVASSSGPTGQSEVSEPGCVSQPMVASVPVGIVLGDAYQIVPLQAAPIEPLCIMLFRAAPVRSNTPNSGTHNVEAEGGMSRGQPPRLLPVISMPSEPSQKTMQAPVSQSAKDHERVVLQPPAKGQQQSKEVHPVRVDDSIRIGTYNNVYITAFPDNWRPLKQ